MGTISRIEVRKSPFLKRKMEMIDGAGINIAEHPRFRGKFILQCLKYWENNIYRVYNKRRRLGLPTSNQLGRSLRISCSPNDTISFSMKHLKHSGDPNEGGGKTNNYGPYLRGKSITGGRGTYVQWLRNRRTGEYRLFDKKIKRGTTKRVNPDYWRRWMRMFRPMITKYTVDMVCDIYDEVDDGRH